MPTYEYYCKACDHEWERDQRISDAPLKTCPKCKARKAKRMISQTSFVLKGSGWYSDLYSSAKDGGKKTEGDDATPKSSGDDATPKSSGDDATPKSSGDDGSKKSGDDGSKKSDKGKSKDKKSGSGSGSKAAA